MGLGRPRLVHRVPTKIKVDSPLAKIVPVVNTKIKVGRPLAKNVPVIRTALPVRPVAHSLVVLLEPTPVVQHRVMHVVLENTTIKPVKPVKLLVKVARRDNTKTKRGKHPATMIVRVPW